MQLVLIPAYFVYDGFEQELGATLVLNCALFYSTTYNNVFSHLTKSLHAVWSSLNVSDLKPYVSGTTLSAMPSIQ